MEYKKPEYLKDIHPAFKKYFSKKVFDGTTPYPPTIQDANKFYLYQVLKIEEIKELVGYFPPLEKDDEPEQFVLSYPDNYLEGFNYRCWQHLNMNQKVVMLYWLNKDITNELEILPVDFCFLTKVPNAEGLHLADDYLYQISINPNSLEYESSYEVVNTIAHELNHAQFFAVMQKKYMDKMNSTVYWSIEQTEDTFENIYEYLMYYCQPVEIRAEVYAYKKVVEVFKKASQKNKTPSLTDLVCINGQKNELVSNDNLKHKIFGNNFEKHLDLYFLLQDMSDNYDNPKISNKRRKELEGDLIAVQNEIDKEKAEFKNNYIKYLSNKLLKEKSKELVK